MKSIKEKAKKWCSEHSNKGCTGKCDGCWQLKQAWGCEQHNMEMAYEAGANYVLEELTKILPKEDRLLNDAGKSLLCRLNGCIKQLDACTDWLKPIRPQNRWKPSDEQMEALHDLNLTGNISHVGQGQVLIGLYNDLKKLRGE